MAVPSPLLSRGLGLVLVEFEYEYEGRDGVLVSIKPNERYILLSKTNDHWWQVRKDSNSKPFYIPAKYVKELPPDFPSPLDFTDPPTPKQVLHPVVAPVPVAVPVPKPLEELSGTRTKQSDEVLISLRPAASNRQQKVDNRMSTFGVMMDVSDLAHMGPQLLKTPSVASTESATSTASRTTNMVDCKKQPHLSSLDDQKDSGKSRVPSFSPADPKSMTRPQNQPIPVKMPVVPPSSMSSPSKGGHEKKEEQQMEEEVAEEEISTESSEEEEESPKEVDSHHIYESIQDLNLDLEALHRKPEGPAAPAEPVQPAHASPTTKDQGSLDPKSVIYTNVSFLKKSSQPQISITQPPADPVPPDPTVFSFSPPSSLTSPASPANLQDGWQVHTDHDSGKSYYYHPATRQTTWSHHHSLTPGGDTGLSSPLSPASSQGSGDWEQLMDETSGRIYFHNPNTGATSWSVPEPQSPMSSPGSTASRTQDNRPPPLPKEDYPDGAKDDTVFTTQQQQQGLIPRAQLEQKDTNIQHKQQEKGLMGNGVCDEGVVLQVRNLRHSIAEETFTPGHRRIASDVTEASRKPSLDSPQGHVLEKAGIINKTKVVDNGKKIRKNWSQSWTVLHGGILTFYKDPKSTPVGNASKASQIVPEYTVELKGASIQWATKDKSSKKHVLELKTRQGCEYLMQSDAENIIFDWFKVVQDTIQQLGPQHHPEHRNLSDDEDEAGSDREDRDKKRLPSRNSSELDPEQSRVRRKLKRFLQRRPTLQSVKEKGYIRDNVFGCHLDTLCHRENTTIPKFVEKCIKTVERRGLDVDGIYRVNGNLAVIQKLRHKADHEEQLDLEDGQWEEIHVVTGALKLFFRELPEPLFPFSSFEKFICAIQLPDYSLRVSYVKDLVRSLPLPNYDTMELLFKHLCRVVEYKESNRMSVQSVAIVFGPTLLRPQTESANLTVHMVFQSQIVELMLNQYKNIFSER
uniref:Rho GTPase activating protein 27 n=2 Tax=Nothobranchius TaxID=28779 RepID=A0A1A8J910_NOTKU